MCDGYGGVLRKQMPGGRWHPKKQLQAGLGWAAGSGPPSPPYHAAPHMPVLHQHRSQCVSTPLTAHACMHGKQRAVPQHAAVSIQRVQGNTKERAERGLRPAHSLVRC